MRILHVIPTLQRGGAERLVIDICRCITTRNLAEIMLITMEDINEYPELSNQIHVQVCNSKVTPSISGKPAVKLDGFLDIVKKFKPDIIHSHLYEADMMSHWVLFPNIRYITHCHDNIRQFKKFGLDCLLNKSILTDLYERNILMGRYRQCKNRFIAISRDTESYLKANLPPDLQNITLMPNAIEFNRFKRADSSARKISPHSTVKLINVGSFVGKKNQAFLIDVMKFLHTKGYNVSLDLLGDGKNRPDIEAKIKEEGLSAIVHCVGKVNHAEKYLHKADIYLHSAIYEPFGLVILEAMAAGLPVVCLDGKGNRDIMEHSRNGFIYQEQNVELFASSIIQLMTNNALYHDISQYAERFAMDYDMEHYIDRLMKFYSSD